MFVEAIKEVQKFTRPVCTISRNSGEQIVSPGAATIFFVNELGCAITCKHVAELVIREQIINGQYEQFKTEKAEIGNKNHNRRVKELEQKYGYKDNVIVQIKSIFLDCFKEATFSIKCILHAKYDLAILVFEGFKTIAYESHAYFSNDPNILQSGRFLCRLGYPFPEFTNFNYNKEKDMIEWTDLQNVKSPRFPIEGMMTRNLLDVDKVFGVELSTPGLRGQSGGPLFTKDGLICGMQAATNHLHLGFDMKNHEYKTGGKTIKVTNQPFFHVGHCIHVDIIKEFLKENDIKFYEK